MTDHARLARLHLERNLKVAESIGDVEWVEQVRRELLGELEEEGLVADKTVRSSAARPEPDVDLAELRAQAEALGVKVDGRWGLDRLHAEIAAASEE